MRIRITGLTVLMLLALGFSAVAHQLHWIDGLFLGQLAAAAAFVVALIGVVRLPWDLTFHARNTVAQMQSMRRRGLDVDEADLEFARKSASRALVLALALHVAGAGLALVARSFLGPEVGFVLAGAFLGSMALRPIYAFYVNTRERLQRSKRNAEVSPPDALSLAKANNELRAALKTMNEELETHRKATQGQLAVIEERTQNEASAWRSAATSADEKLERVLREFERTVEKNQQNGDVLTGIRAFVQLIRES